MEEFPGRVGSDLFQNFDRSHCAAQCHLDTEVTQGHNRGLSRSPSITRNETSQEGGQQQREHSSPAQLTPLSLFAPILIDTHSSRARMGLEPLPVAFSTLLALSLLFVKKGQLGKGAPW